MSPFFAVRTTAGQEKNVALLIQTRVEAKKIPIHSIVVPEDVKGFIFVETDNLYIVEQAVTGIRHVKGWVPGKVDVKEIEFFLLPKSPLEGLTIGDVVDIVSGPFRGMKGKVTRIDDIKEEVTLELLEATYTLPITVHADSIRKSSNL